MSDETSDRDEALSVLSDVFKEINGWRPRGMYRTEDMTAADAWAEIDRLQAEEDDRLQAKAARKAATEVRISDAFKAEGLTFSPFASFQLNKVLSEPVPTATD